MTINERTPKTTAFNDEIDVYPTKRERVSKCQKYICFQEENMRSPGAQTLRVFRLIKILMKSQDQRQQKIVVGVQTFGEFETRVLSKFFQREGLSKFYNPLTQV